MSRYNFYSKHIPETGEILALAPEEAAHGVRVLRLTRGDRVGVLDGCGTRAEAEVTETRLTKRRASLSCRILQRRRVAAPDPRVSLYVAPPRAKEMVRIVHMATELGVYRITPVVCEDSVAKPTGKDVPEHWTNDAVAAVKQSGNPYLPEMSPPVPFDEALRESGETGFYGDAPASAGEAPRFKPSLEGRPAISVWVGPEAGFSLVEKQAMNKRGILPVSVGRWILRVETAVPVLLGWLIGRRGMS